MKSPKPAKKQTTNQPQQRSAWHSLSEKTVHPPRQGEGTGTPKRLIKEQPETPGTHQINTKNSTSAHYRVLKKHTHTRPDQATPGRFKQQVGILNHPPDPSQTRPDQEVNSPQTTHHDQRPCRHRPGVSLAPVTLHTGSTHNKTPGHAMETLQFTVRSPRA